MQRTKQIDNEKETQHSIGKEKDSGSSEALVSKEEVIFDLIRELINSAKQEDKVRYRVARKELKRLKMNDPEARRFINYALKGLPK